MMLREQAQYGTNLTSRVGGKHVRGKFNECKSMSSLYSNDIDNANTDHICSPRPRTKNARSTPIAAAKPNSKAQFGDDVSMMPRRCNSSAAAAVGAVELDPRKN